MVRYTAEREIARGVDEVFAFLSDATRQAAWVHGVTSCRWVDGGGRPGAVAEQSMTFLGRARTVPMTLVEHDRPRRVVFEKQQPFPIRFGFELEPRGGRTRVRYPVEMAPTGLFRLLIPLVGRRTIEGDLERIAKCLEAAG